jgi:hypothetical protein
MRCRSGFEACRALGRAPRHSRTLVTIVNHNPFDPRAPWEPNGEGTTLERLASQRPPDVALDREQLDTIAKLAHMLTQRHAEQTDPRFVLSPLLHVPYEARSEESRAGMRTGVVRVIQALTMLGLIEP